MILATVWPPNLVVAQDRHALVVGIDEYHNIDDLHKATNDARAVSGVLDEIGFEVTTLLDADERRFNRQLADFTAAIDPGDEVVFYFAGHGIEIEGQNYLLPSDAPDSPSERVILSDSINADEVLRDVQRAGASIAVMILDACRDNPYGGSGRSVGGARGLNIIAAPEGSFVLMSAASGAVAFEGDDDDPNSIFTRALLPLLQEPGLALPDLARQLRRDVQDLASQLGHRQRPAYYDEVAGEFFFRAAITQPPPRPQQAIAPQNPCEAARQDWSILGESPSARHLEIFLQTHPDCQLLRAMAEDRLAALTSSGSAPVQPSESDQRQGDMAQMVLASVDGVHITIGHVIAMVTMLPQDYQSLPDEVLFDGVLEQLIQQEVLAALAGNRQAMISGFADANMGTRARLSVENEIRALLASQYMVQLEESTVVTDDDIQSAYDAEYASEYNASHILIETEAEARLLIQELVSGADFATLARTHSIGPSGANGGELGWFSAGMMVPSFEEAVFSLNVGEISPPVQTQFGWHVVTLNDVRVRSAPPLREVSEEIIEEVRRAAVDARVNELIDTAEVVLPTIDINPSIIREVDLIND